MSICLSKDTLEPATAAVKKYVDDGNLAGVSPRLSWLDTGLVNYAAGIQKEVFGAKDICNAWRGIVAEHVTGQEILALDNSVLNRKTFR